MSHFKKAHLAFAPGAGESAFLIAEQLALQQTVGQRAQVDRHERLKPPHACRVDALREQLLAGA